MSKESKPDTPRFVIGDKVVVAEGKWFFSGRTGVVMKVVADGIGQEFLIDFSQGDFGWIPCKRLSLAPSPYTELLAAADKVLDETAKYFAARKNKGYDEDLFSLNMSLCSLLNASGRCHDRLALSNSEKDHHE